MAGACACGGYCTGGCDAGAAMVESETRTAPCDRCGEFAALTDDLCAACLMVINVGCQCAKCHPAPAVQRVTVGGARPGESMEIEVPIYAPVGQ